MFEPQHLTVPSAISAQPLYMPVSSWTALATSLTATGVALSFSVPSPSWPSTLDPQQETVPASASAHA